MNKRMLLIMVGMLGVYFLSAPTLKAPLEIGCPGCAPRLRLPFLYYEMIVLNWLMNPAALNDPLSSGSKTEDNNNPTNCPCGK